MMLDEYEETRDGRNQQWELRIPECMNAVYSLLKKMNFSVLLLQKKAVG